MRRFYAPPENFAEGRVMLDAGETRHLRDVLRLKQGDKARVFDGESLEFDCEIEQVGKSSSVLRILGPALPAAPESPLDLTLAVAILKGEKSDLVVQKSVELGVTAIVPLITARGDVKLNDSAKRLARWKKIALEAAKQCGRARLTAIHEPAVFSSYLTAEPGACRILFSERGGIDFASVAAGKKMTAFVGPEGGWDDSELELAATAGVEIVTLGGRVMRAETAALAVAAIIQHRFGDLN